MKNIHLEATETNISMLQNNFKFIEEYFNLSDRLVANSIGVTRQTINKIKNKQYKLTKTQYLAIMYVIEGLVTEEDIDAVYDLLTKEIKTMKKKFIITIKEESK